MSHCRIALDAPASGVVKIRPKLETAKGLCLDVPIAVRRAALFWWLADIGGRLL
jgi:hypothetical protein